MFMCFPSYVMLISDGLILLRLYFDVSEEVTGSGHNGKYGTVPHSVVGLLHHHVCHLWAGWREEIVRSGTLSQACHSSCSILHLQAFTNTIPSAW